MTRVTPGGLHGWMRREARRELTRAGIAGLLITAVLAWVIWGR